MATFKLLTNSWLDHELRTDDSTQLFTSTRRAQAVNDGLLEFAELTECFIRQSTIACSCNTQEYNLNSSAITSTDFVRVAAQGIEYHVLSSGGSSIAKLSVLAGDDFPRRDIEWLNRYDAGWQQSTTPVTPTGYYLRADGGQYIFGFDRRPNIKSSEVATLVLPYVARPVAMTSSGDIPFTVGGNTRTDLLPFHRAFVHYAAHQLEKLRGDDQASDRQLARFQEFVQRFIQKFRNKNGNWVTFGRHYLKDARRVPRGAVWGSGHDPRIWP